MKQYLQPLAHLVDLLLPRYCLCCNTKLLLEEPHLCLTCLMELPLSYDWNIKHNELQRKINDSIPVEQVVALLHYESNSKFRKIVHHLKYKNQPKVGSYFGQMLAQKIFAQKILADADYICPIPLHPKKERKRGYNQSAYLARAIAEHAHIGYNDTNLIRIAHSSTQTKKNREERQLNMQGIFQCVNPELFQDKHIVLIDDVITTGATIKSCALSVLSCCQAQISMLCLARIRT